MIHVEVISEPGAIINVNEFLFEKLEIKSCFVELATEVAFCTHAGAAIWSLLPTPSLSNPFPEAIVTVMLFSKAESMLGVSESTASQ